MTTCQSQRRLHGNDAVVSSSFLSVRRTVVNTIPSFSITHTQAVPRLGSFKEAVMELYNAIVSLTVLSKKNKHTAVTITDCE